MALSEILPSHVLSHVLSLLPPNEALRFACVSRSAGLAAALLQGLTVEVPVTLWLCSRGAVHVHDRGFCTFLRSPQAATVQEVVVTLHWKDVVRNDCGGCCGEPVWQPLARAVEAPSSAVRRISLRLVGSMERETGVAAGVHEAAGEFLNGLFAGHPRLVHVCLDFGGARPVADHLLNSGRLSAALLWLRSPLASLELLARGTLAIQSIEAWGLVRRLALRSPAVRLLTGETPQGFAWPEAVTVSTQMLQYSTASVPVLMALADHSQLALIGPGTAEPWLSPVGQSGEPAEGAVQTADLLRSRGVLRASVPAAAE